MIRSIHLHRIFHSQRHMSAGVRIRALAILLSIVAALSFGQGSQKDDTPKNGMPAADVTETAVLAGGCFWGVEAVFERLDGVLDVASGYSGGDADTASYYEVGSGTTGHAESVEIIYDPDRIDFKVLLEVFFNVAHDPTQLNYQGPDRGTEYRSAVFYADEEQKRITEQYIKELAAEKIYAGPIVTQVVPLEEFYPAEDYHQDFMQLNPEHPYILYWDLPKIIHLEKTYPELLAERQ